MNGLSALGQLASAVAGNPMYYMANKSIETEVTDYTKCPNCGSKNYSNYYGSGDEETYNVIQRQNIEINSNATVESLIQRVELFIEEGDWNSALVYCNHILDAEPQNSTMYLYKLFIECKCKTVKEIADKKCNIEESVNFQRILKYGTQEQIDFVNNIVQDIANKKKEEAEIAAKKEEQSKKERILAEQQKTINDARCTINTSSSIEK